MAYSKENIFTQNIFWKKTIFFTNFHHFRSILTSTTRKYLRSTKIIFFAKMMLNMYVCHKNIKNAHRMTLATNIASYVKNLPFLKISYFNPIFFLSWAILFFFLLPTWERLNQLIQTYKANINQLSQNVARHTFKLKWKRLRQLSQKAYVIRNRLSQLNQTTIPTRNWLS